MARVLWELGFSGRVVLGYRPQPGMLQVLREREQGNLLPYLQGLMDAADSPDGGRALTGFPFAIRREARAATGLSGFATLLSEAMDLVEPKRIQKLEYEHELWLGERKASGDFAVLQALALLRRLRLIGLQRCSLEIRNGLTIDLSDASSGQQQMICSVFGLVAELRSNSLVLIDEPELSLHPTWQMSYLDRMDGLLSPFTGCHLLVATHSALLVQKGRSAGLDVTTLGRQFAAVKAEAENEDQLIRKEVSVEETLVDVFRTPISGSVFLANELFTLVNRAEDATNQLTRQASLARLSELRNTFADSSSTTKDVELIEKAIALVESASTDDDTEVETAG